MESTSLGIWSGTKVALKLLPSIWKLTTKNAPYKISLNEFSSRGRNNTCQFQRDFAGFKLNHEKNVDEIEACLALLDSCNDTDEVKILWRKTRDLFKNGNKHFKAEMKTVIGNLTEQSERYFKESRSNVCDYPVRISVITLLKKTSKDESQKIIRLLPIALDKRAPTITELNSHSLFSQVASNPKTLICQNTIKKIDENHNFSHGEELSKKQFPKIRTKKFRQSWKDKKIVARWRRAVKKIEFNDKAFNDLMFFDEPNGFRAFKSVMIVPITFSKHLANPIAHNDELDRYARVSHSGSVFGFLMITHPEAYYFDDADASSDNNLDNNFLMQIADLTSLVMLWSHKHAELFPRLKGRFRDVSRRHLSGLLRSEKEIRDEIFTFFNEFEERKR